MGLQLTEYNSNQDFSKPKSSFRKAGDAFSNNDFNANKQQDFRNDSSKARNMIPGMYSKQKSEKEAAANAAKAANEAKYKYYKSDFGTGTGADAYATDMENYENQPESIQGMPHVHAMFHPDWGRSQKTGGGNPVVEQDYSTRPNFAPGSKAAARFEMDFGSDSGSSGGGYKSSFKY